jgi:predicted PurR-regulated permease PerM
METQTSRNMILWFFLGLFLISCGLLGLLLWPFVSILVMAAVCTGAFLPVYRYLVGFPRIKPGVASLITCIIVFIVLFVPIVLFVGILSGEAFDMVQWARGAELGRHIRTVLDSSTIVEEANQVLARFNFELTGDQFNEAITEAGRQVGLFLYRQSTAIASNFFIFFVNFFLMLLVVFFLLMDGHRLVSFILDLSPLPTDQEEKLVQKFKDIAGAVLFGNGLCGLIQGVLGGTMFWLFGLRSPFMWGVIMGLLAFLPIVGVGLVFVPAAGYLLLTGRVGAGIFFIIFYIFLSGGVEYLLKPKLVGTRIQMHTLLVFLAIIGGLKLFGILGIIYGPLVVTAFMTLTDIYHSSYEKLIDPKE